MSARARAEVDVLTDTWAAERFAARHSLALRCVHPGRRWLRWDGARWAPAEAGEVERAAIETARSIFIEASDSRLPADRAAAMAKFAIRCESRAGLEAMIALAEVQELLVVQAGELDRNRMLLATPTETVNLATGKAREADRGDLITKVTGAPFVHAAKCIEWEKFLARVVPSENLREFLRRAVGYSLTGAVAEHALFFLYGLGRNGKSTLLAVLRRVLGDYAGSAPFDLLLTTRGEQHPTALAELAGRRLVVAVEAGAGRSLNEPLVKWLTGGDRLTARRMRMDFSEFDPTHKLWLGANHRPRIRGTDTAIWRRVKLIPFEVEIPEAEVDTHLVDKLAANGPGILQWAIEGCLAWQREGLGEPDEVRAATAEYRKAEDRVGRFLDEACRLDPEATTPMADLYAAYQRWCQEAGEHPEPKRDFGEALSERGLQAAKGQGGARVRRGLVLQVAQVAHGGAVFPMSGGNGFVHENNLQSAPPAPLTAEIEGSSATKVLPPEAIWSPEELEEARRQTSEPAVGDAPTGDFRTPGEEQTHEVAPGATRREGAATSASPCAALEVWPK